MLARKMRILRLKTKSRRPEDCMDEVIPSSYVCKLDVLITMYYNFTTSIIADQDQHCNQFCCF